jgi:8-oxo-dGTP pyrophosphatase MutT (NUDIX family)
MAAGDSPRHTFRISHLRQLQECAQAAAVCYRVGSRGIEFLLVRTRSGRWTFPKGAIEPGLRPAQAAALEAFEEAGAHGWMEEDSFTRYTRRKGKKSRAGELVISAHLCHVLRLSPPQESDRDRTWFSPARARRSLQRDRHPEDAAELARVLDHAVTRIRHLHRANSAPIRASRPETP